MGSITLFLGSMKSSKTSKLFEVLDQAKYRKNVKSCLVRPELDTREFISRYGKILDNEILLCKFLLEIEKELQKYDVICIDEGQFIFDLGPVSNKLALLGKEIYIAALNGDSDMNPWNSISNLLPFVDKIERFSGICENCGQKKATFSFHEGKKQSQTEIGDFKYKIYCRKCWYEKTSLSE